MARIAILTPDPKDEQANRRWPEVWARTCEPLVAAGHEVAGRRWTTADDLAAFDLVLPLLAWGYPQSHDAWIGRVADWEGQGVRLHNPAPVLRWNSDKAYLGRLAERGAPVVPTRFVDRVTAEAMDAIAADFGSARLVAKPQISSGGWQTVRWSLGEPLDGGPAGPAMVQPYLPGVESDGEISLLFLGGRFSHAVRKRPQPGDFRVQPEYDGIIAASAPTADEHAAAAAVLRAIDDDLLYARIDLVPGLDGKPALIEIELIEPDLYLGYDPGAGQRFATAVEQLLSR